MVINAKYIFGIISACIVFFGLWLTSLQILTQFCDCEKVFKIFQERHSLLDLLFVLEDTQVAKGGRVSELEEENATTFKKMLRAQRSEFEIDLSDQSQIAGDRNKTQAEVRTAAGEERRPVSVISESLG